jgi:Fe2+ transport system protein B
MTANAAPPRVRRQVFLVGRANAGKTSLLMHLTGTLQRPVNFPGTSVEAIESGVEVDGVELRVVDLPGIASLEPCSRDEELALLRLRRPTSSALCSTPTSSSSNCGCCTNCGAWVCRSSSR